MNFTNMRFKRAFWIGILWFICWGLVTCGKGGEVSECLVTGDVCGRNTALDFEQCKCVSTANQVIDYRQIREKSYVIPCFFDGETWPIGMNFVELEIAECELIPPIALYVADYKDVNLYFRATLLDQDLTLPESSPIFSTAADFTFNPHILIRYPGVILLPVYQDTLVIENISIILHFSKNEIDVADASLLGTIADVTPLESAIGSDPCGLIPGICDRDGKVTIKIDNLGAIIVPDLVIPDE